MAKGPRHTVRFRRRRAGKTNYNKRRKMLKEIPRLVVRKSNKYFTLHITKYSKDGDKTITFARSSELNKLGWKYGCKNLPAAYLIGLIVGKKAIKAGIKQAILDLGLYSITKGSRLFAALKGAVDAGLNIPHDPKMFPAEERLTGNFISADVAKNFEDARAKLNLAGPSRSETSARVRGKIK